MTTGYKARLECLLQAPDYTMEADEGSEKR